MLTFFPVKFPPEHNFDLMLLAARLSSHVGLGAQACPPAPGTNTGSIAFENGVLVELVIFDHGEVGVVYNGNPTYFEWATIAELREQGGDIGDASVPQDVAMTWSAYEKSRSRSRRWWKLW